MTTSTTDSPSTQRPKIGLLLLGFVTFMALGLPGGYLGVALPSLMDTFQIAEDTVGILWVFIISGFLFSSINLGRILARLDSLRVLMLGSIGLCVGLAGYALAPRWELFLVAAVVEGMGAGLVDAALNDFAARHYSRRLMNGMHAFFSIGAGIGPLLGAQLLAAGIVWRWGYALAGMLWATLIVGYGVAMYTERKSARVVESLDTQTPTEKTPSARSRDTLRLPLMWYSMAAFFVYTGAELTVGAWGFTLLHKGRLLTETSAGLWMTLFWVSLAAGRLAAGLTSYVNRIEATQLLRLCIVGTLSGTVLLWLNLAPALSLVGLMLIGFSLAPMFPSMMSNTPARLGAAHTSNAVGFQMAAAASGVMVVPGMVGVLVSAFDYEVIGLVLVINTLAMLALHELAARRERVRGRVLVGQS